MKLTLAILLMAGTNYAVNQAYLYYQRYNDRLRIIDRLAQELFDARQELNAIKRALGEK